MFELNHHCFGKVENLSVFENYPTPGQIQKAIPKSLKKRDGWLERLSEKQSLALDIGEWLEIKEVNYAD